MMVDVIPLIDKFLTAADDADPQPAGGIAAFELEDYRRSMLKDAAYECHVTIAWLDPFNFVHKTVVPSWGSVLRIYSQFFHNMTTGAPGVDGPLSTIHVRATSKTDPPQKGGLQRLNNDAYVLAFLYAWAESTRHGTADQFVQAATRIRVAFLFLPDADTAERRKWMLMEEARSSSENQHLFGIKRAHAVYNLQQELKARCASHDADALTAWFKGVKFSSTDDAMTKGSIERQLKIWLRMSADQRILDALEQLESMYGKRHALASSSALDVLCNKTAMKTSTLVQTALTLFTTEAIMVMHARGDLPMETSRDSLGNKIIPQLLLKRRVIHYLNSKFRFENRSDLDVAVPADRMASAVISKVFGSFLTFHACFPRGRAVGDAPVVDDDDANMVQIGSQPWLTNLLPCHQTLVEFLKDMCGCHPYTEPAVKAACARDAGISAENFMARADVAAVFDVQAFSDEFASETRVPTPAMIEVVKAMEAVAEPPSRPEVQVEPTDQPIPTDQGIPAEAVAEPPAHPADTCFPLLQVGSAMRDKLEKVDRRLLQLMIDHANTRVAMYVELKIRPNYNQLAAAVQDFSLFQQAKDASARRIIWSYDTKCWSDGSMTQEAARYGSRQLPEFDDTDFTGVCDALFGLKDAKNRFDECAFRVQATAANDLLLVFDGRRATTLDKVEKVIKTSLKNTSPCFAAKLCVPVRMMHTSSQFGGGAPTVGGMRRSNGDAVHASLPDPLESFALVFCKSFRLPVVARRFIDLPGTSRTRGLNQVPARDPLEMGAGVTVKQKRAMLDSATFRRGAAALVEDGDFDAVFAEDERQPGEQQQQPGEQQQQTGQQQHDMTVTDSVIDGYVVPLFTWENSEILWRELLNMYRPQGSVGGVVDFTAGTGLAALAAVRHKILYAGFARTADHINYIRASLVLMIVGELIDGKNDGFLLRRFLGRQRSLDGGHDRVSSLDRAPQPYAAVAGPPAAPPSAAGQAPAPLAS
jgi:hypothetical protein